MSATSTRTFFAPVHIFAGLSEEVLTELTAFCQEVHAPAGTVIVEQGVMGREMYLIRRGEIHIVSHRQTPRETLLAKLGPGGFFGEMCLIECRRRSAAAIATTPAVLHALAYADIHRLFKWRPEEFSILILNIARDLCRRLRTMNDRCAGNAASGDTQRAIVKMRPATRLRPRPLRA